MPDIYGILSIGKDALLTQQRGIDVTGQNIANVNTPGYSRQRVVMETKEPIDFFPGQIGTGVRATEVRRIYDRFIGMQLSAEQEQVGRWDARMTGLEKVEMLFDESGGYGLNKAMSEFWNAWQDVSDNPSGQAERVALQAKSQTLADQFRKLRKDLVEVQKDMDVSVAGTLEEINRLATQIAQLNQKIAQTEVGGQNANDLRDKRDGLITELSQKIDIESFENSNGKVTVLVAGGRPLVEEGFSWRLGTAPTPSGVRAVVWTDGEGNQVDITATIRGGKVKGWLEVRDHLIPRYLAQLDQLAAGLIAAVNAEHRTGYGLDGSFNNDFFTGTDASDIAFNPALAADLRLIAASDTATGVPGDNGHAIRLAELQHTLTMNGNTITFDEYYNSLITTVGNDSQEAATYSSHHTAMSTHLSNYRESISGVSLDEEMVNLVQFQHAYQAAAKLITTVDELLVTVINMVD